MLDFFLAADRKLWSGILHPEEGLDKLRVPSEPWQTLQRRRLKGSKGSRGRTLCLGSCA